MDHLSIKLSDASGVPFYRQIVDQIAQLIRAGQLIPGARLPSVRELAGLLMVSLITVRRSYADLEMLGLIRRRQGYGTYVADDVKTATREQAVAETRSKLAEALSHAERLGLGRDDLEAIIDELLSRKGDDHGNS